MNKHKYISRIDSGNNHCWYFRFAQRENWSNISNKTFTDRLHGSKSKALKAAIKYRNEYLKQCGKLDRLDKNTNPIRHRHALNKSGIIGVHFQVDYKKHNEYPNWVASGMINKISWRRAFGTNKHGNKKAFQLACTERFNRHGLLAIVLPISQLTYKPAVPYKRYKAFANTQV